MSLKIPEEAESFHIPESSRANGSQLVPDNVIAGRSAVQQVMLTREGSFLPLSSPHHEPVDASAHPEPHPAALRRGLSTHDFLGKMKAKLKVTLDNDPKNNKNYAAAASSDGLNIDGSINVKPIGEGFDSEEAWV